MEKMMRRWKREMVEVIGEMRGMREEIKEQRGELKKEMEEMRKEMREQERRWREEREEMRRTTGKLERRVERLEGGGKAGIEWDRNEVEIGKRLREMERKMEMKEREERRKNFLIKVLEVKEGKRREAVEEILKTLGVDIEIKEMRRIGRDGNKEMILVGTGGRAEKGSNKKEKEFERQEREDMGRLDVGGEKDEVETGGNREKRRKERGEGMDWIWEDKDWRAMVEVG